MSDAFTTATCTAPVEPLTIEKIKEAIAKVEALGPEPFAEYMRKQGMPQEDGYVLLLPESLREKVGVFVPHYVKFSYLPDAPCIYLDLMRALKAKLGPVSALDMDKANG